MSSLVPTTAFGAEVLAHLDAQLHSASRLLEHVLGQATAIREKDVATVLVRLEEIQAEMERRSALEQERARILTRAGQALGVPAHVVTLDAMGTLLGAAMAAAAKQRSAELRGLLAEIAREHRSNRALMKQELAFLDHLMRQLGAGGQESAGGYGANGAMASSSGGAYRPVGRDGDNAPTVSALRALDLQA